VSIVTINFCASLVRGIMNNPIFDKCYNTMSWKNIVEKAGTLDKCQKCDLLFYCLTAGFQLTYEYYK
jgi:hypothetical protein